MTETTKQTALFFGFLASAMTYASAQATPAQPQAGAPVAIERLMAECGVSARAADAPAARPDPRSKSPTAKSPAG